jgi:hypothetical protein
MRIVYLFPTITTPNISLFIGIGLLAGLVFARLTFSFRNWDSKSYIFLLITFVSVVDPLAFFFFFSSYDESKEEEE